MGGGVSTRHRRKVDGYILLDSSKINKLSFDPSQSQAVCTGVGRHLNMCRRKNDIPTCDADGKLIAEVFGTSLLIPSSNIRLLSSESEYAATKSNIEDCLRSAAKDVGPGGALFFYFSGHATRIGSSVAIVPADFVADRQQLMSGKFLVSVLKALPSPEIPVVIILDCCFAAGIAREVVASLDGGRNKIYFLAACAAVESTIVTKQLGASIFTYFMADYLKRRRLDNCFPMKALMDHCAPLCNALGGLLLRNDTDSDENLIEESMNPTLFGAQPVCHFLNGRQKVRVIATDVADGSFPQFEVDFKWSEQVSRWLAENAQPKLKVLKKSKHVYETKVYMTATCLMMQSMGMLAGKQRPDLAGNSATFLDTFCCVMKTVDEVVGQLSEENEFDELSPSLAYYYRGVKATGRDMIDLKELVSLFKTLRKDEKTENERDGVEKERWHWYAEEIAQTAQPIEQFD